MEEVKEKSMREIIKEKREKDGYHIVHKFAGKCTVEEMIGKMIKSHTC